MTYAELAAVRGIREPVAAGADLPTGIAHELFTAERFKFSLFNFRAQ